MAEHIEMSEEYSKIGMDLIQKEPLLEYIKNSEATIVFLSSDKEKKSKGKDVCGICEKIPDKYKWAIPADFTITVYEPNIIAFSQKQIRILLYHELLHIRIEEKNGEESYSCNPHDIEDFRDIIDRFGLDWSQPEWRIVDG